MKHLLTIAVIALVLGSCGNKEKVAKLNSSKDSLENIVTMKDSIINEAFLDINDIATTLDQITEREKLVTKESGGEITKTTKQKIADNIAAISELLQKNRETIARLTSSTKKLKEANVQIDGLKKLVASLQQQLEDKNTQIEQLAEQVKKLNIEISDLNTAVSGLREDKEKLEGTVSEQTTQLNTVYYIIASEKELINKKIIDKKGFIARTKVVGSNADDMEFFTQGDLREIEKLPINQKKMTIVTSHPSDSYMLIMGSKNMTEEIVITDKDKFWKSSKILIISYK